MKDRPVSLNSLVFSNSKGEGIVTEDYHLTFSSHKHCELFIQERYRYWTDLLGIKLVIAEDKNETLEEIETLKVLEMVCERLGVDYMQARSKSQKSEVIDARRLTMNISFNRKVNKSTIAKALGLDHSTVIHHIKQLANLCKFDREEKKRFIDLEDWVLINLNGHETKI